MILLGANRRPTVELVLFVATCLTASWSANAGEPAEPRNDVPEKYVLDYPTAERFCPPIRSAFVEAEQSFGVVRGRRFTYKPNGGYGLPVIDKVEGKNLLHAGADLGWYQIGEPVFAVAAGVVRVSSGPTPEEKDTKDKKKSAPAADPKPRGQPPDLSWGNVVMIEHRLPNGEFFTTICGHLDHDRRVAVGDVVQAGQRIGSIGRKNPQINGGFNPHTHFGVRKGRNAEVGAVIMRMRINGEAYPIKIAALQEDFVELDLPDSMPRLDSIRLNDVPFPFQERDGKRCLPAKILWVTRRPDFPLVGYELKLDAWHDPLAFLREHQADTNPAPFAP